MNESDLHYPPETCPFCNIAAAFPFPQSPLWNDERGGKGDLSKCVPEEEEGDDTERTSPSSFVVLRSRDVVAFLDILPMVGGTSFDGLGGFSVVLGGKKRRAFHVEEGRNSAKVLHNTY
jgi:hypothetical protein